MPRVTVQLLVNVEGIDPVAASFEQTVDHEPGPDGVTYFIEEGILSLKTDLLYNQFLGQPPSTTDLFPDAKPTTYTLDDLATDKAVNDANKRELWTYLGNLALTISHSLARAQALQQLQRTVEPSNERVHILLQIDKMAKLDSAVRDIAKLRDLHKRILIEALGGMDFQLTLPNGRKRKARSVKEILDHRHEFQAIDKLDEQQFKALEEIAAKLEESATTNTHRFLFYKNKLAHDTPQIVDNPLYYPQLQDRRWRPIKNRGKEVGRTRIFQRRTKPDWVFDDLFVVVVEAFKHYLNTLRSLKSWEQSNT